MTQTAVSKQLEGLFTGSAPEGQGDQSVHQDQKPEISTEKMVGVARIELATPAMSTRATKANALISCVSVQKT